MKISTIAAGIALAAAALPGVATAQRWQGIDARQSSLETRIDRGVRSGALDRHEAVRLRADFRQLGRLEQRYRAGGLSGWERQDLSRRFDALSARIRFDRNDRDHRRPYR